MTKSQSDYFDITSHQFSISEIKNPLRSQLLEMEHLESALALPAGSEIIDFGCGSGRLSIFFLSRGYHVTALDISQKSLINLNHIYQLLYQPGWGRLSTKIQLSGSLYDGLVGSDILHHVVIKEVLPKLNRYLKPGGRIAFSEPNALNFFWYVHYVFKRIPWKIESGITQNTIYNLETLFKHNLFKAVVIRGHGLFPTRLLNFSESLCRLNCLILGNLFVFRPLAYRFIISAEKVRFSIG